MAIFEGEIPKVDIKETKPAQLLPSPEIKEVNPYVYTDVSPEKSRDGLSGEQLSALGRSVNQPMGWDSPH